MFTKHCWSFDLEDAIALGLDAEMWPVLMQRCHCWSWPCEVELGGCRAPAGCSCGAPPPPHPDADAPPAISSFFLKVPKCEAHPFVRHPFLILFPWWLCIAVIHSQKNEIRLLVLGSPCQSSGPAAPLPWCSLSAPSLCVFVSLSGTESEPSLPPPSALKHMNTQMVSPVHFSKK